MSRLLLAAVLLAATASIARADVALPPPPPPPPPPANIAVGAFAIAALVLAGMWLIRRRMHTPRAV